MLVAFWSVALVAVQGCDNGPPPSTASPITLAVRPAVQIDQDWKAVDDLWTFTGNVDPQGEATDVILEIGPGPATARRFDTRVPVQQDLTAAGSLRIDTREIPDIDEICVRFTATNSGGTTSSSPLCFPHDLPSFAPTAPIVEIDERWTAANGEWTFKGRIDPKGVATDVVLEIGSGPASSGKFETKVPAAQDLTDAATLTITTREIPDVDEVCVRFTATNSVGTSSSTPLCFQHDSPGSS
jgi:hypothetical protein